MSQDQSCCIRAQRSTDKRSKFDMRAILVTAGKRFAPRQLIEAINEKCMYKLIGAPAVELKKICKQRRGVGQFQAETRQAGVRGPTGKGSV